ncbi:MAG TPA: isoprenylcysteine carboxylmethyltransferase family protein [Methanospirillum sp.]|uniref:methyltransferase family protein n=1 Tax=Methanospirillum sp. TaxID=45200 RepID=UPI002BB2AB05|nr:isoprenylcysteine carboxylmethyltransferase family protein [Methanospirillum sp.]HWQ64968.1 isoprenylcysteine carboxylmethyltransferase family protein [Methanospirillum sp.]
MIFSQAFTSAYTPIWYLTLILWIISELYLIYRDRNTTKKKDQGSRRYIGIAVITGIALSFLVGYNPLFQFQIDPDTIIGISIAIMWAGIIIRFLAIRTLGRHFRTLIHIRDDHTIVKTGLYHTIRHPAYLGSIISAFGVTMVFQNYLIPIIVVGILMPAVMFRISHEEAALCDHLGPAYEEYMKETWRLIPFIY